MPEGDGPLHERDGTENAEPATAATAISAHTMSTFMRPTSVEMRNPIPTMGVPKNSATMAPISARVELIFSALKMKGAAAGSRSFTRVCQ